MDQGAIEQSRETAEKQALRLRRFALAASSYGLSIALLWIAHEMGFIHRGTFGPLAAIMVGVNVALYAAFRSGFNLRFTDPSLTKVQVFLGTTVLMMVLYATDEGRGTAISMCFLIFLFGVFRLPTRELVL